MFSYLSNAEYSRHNWFLAFVFGWWESLVTDSLKLKGQEVCINEEIQSINILSHMVCDDIEVEM